MAEVVGFASAIAGLVALAAQITSISYRYLSDVRDAKHTRSQYLAELSALTDTLLHAETAAVDAEHLDPSAPRPASLSAEVLEDCHNHLSSLKNNLEARAATSSGSLTRLKSSLTWPLEEQQMKKHIEMLHRFRSIFADYVSARTLALSTVSYTKLDMLSQERDHRHLVELFCPPHPLHHGPPTEPPCPGTGKWFLESNVYVQWHTGAPSVLWCHGNPGVGKSMLSSIILQDLSQHPKASDVIYYFCDFAAGKQQTATAVLQTLTRQMLMDVNSAQISVLKRCREHLSTPPTLKEITHALIELCKLQDTAPWIVIDALDELEDRRLFLPLLGEFVKAGCHIFATSRPLPDIADAFSAFTQVELVANHNDLKLFVESELKGSDLCDMDSGNDIVNTIVEKADGIFLLAQLLMSHVLGLTTLKQIRQSLVALPSNLNSAYQSTLERIMVQTTSRRILALRAIAWIINAERRLTIAELLHAFAVEEGEDEIDDENITTLRILLQVCVGLVVVSDDTTITLVHATAHTFFKSMDTPEFANTQLDMARTCLRYLCMSTPFSTGPCSNVLEMNHRLDQMSFLTYAAHYWGQHARGMEQPLAQLICRLLSDTSLRGSSFQALHYRRHLDSQLADASFAALPTGQGPLHVAASWDLGEAAETYLDSNSLVLVDAQGWTPLHWACFKCSAVVRELLLRNGASVNICDTHNWTPLFWASFNGDAEALTSLLNHGADHLIRDIYSWTALQWAVSAGARNTVELLLGHHTQFLARRKEEPRKLVASLSVAEAQLQHAHRHRSIVPAEIAADIGDADLLDVLLQAMTVKASDSAAFNNGWKRAHFDPPMSNIWRTLSKAERINGPDSTSASLFDPYYKVQNLGEWRSRLLHVAIRDDKIIMVQLLLELGADPNNIIHGRPALHTAAGRREHRLVELILAAGGDPILYDARGRTALHQAVMNGFEETAMALIRGGADVNAVIQDSLSREREIGPDVSGFTPLMLASGLKTAVTSYDRRLNYHKADPILPASLAYLLLSAGADANSFDKSGRSVLHHAVMAHDLNLVKLLLDNGTPIPEPDPHGYCIIHAFAQSRARGRSPEDLETFLDLLLQKSPTGAESMECRKVSSLDSPYSSVHRKSHMHCPLSLALHSGNWGIFTALLKRNAQLRTTQPLEPFLRQAIRQLQPGAVHFLLDHGAKLEGDGGVVRDLLWESTRLCSEECAREAFTSILTDLIKAGADVNSVNSGLLSAVKHTTEIPGVIQALLDVGADLHQIDGNGLDLFMISLIQEKVPTLSCLLENNAKKPRQNEHWTQPVPSPLPDDIIAYLCACLKQHNLVLQRTKSNKSFLQLAVEAGSAHTVAHLITCGADPEEVDQHGWRPLHTAIFRGHGAVVDVLLSNGVDVHAATQKWPHDDRRPSALRVADMWTGQPLHLAAMIGDVRIVRELLARGSIVCASTGSNPHCRCFPVYGPTALDIALDKDVFQGKMGVPLDHGRLEIATMLVEHGADVRGTASHLTLDDVGLFEGREDLWDKLRAGVTEEQLVCKSCAAYL
ncbi:ankyrin repeat-containing domain protein [Mycena metata]|uniref:Ankyrin repeat-containing domain protein n=1 Tax=Mycena metata TaxID=1033252 RepID=A0AAD7JJL3_9AGAR|nr:ankyrin repeat-containing domain protein [Mycena metata]